MNEHSSFFFKLGTKSLCHLFLLQKRQQPTITRQLKQWMGIVILQDYKKKVSTSVYLNSNINVKVHAAVLVFIQNALSIYTTKTYSNSLKI
jgi:hypothetical protein